MNQAKSCAIPFAPFKVIGKGPGKIALYFDTFFFCAQQRIQMLLKIANSVLVVDFPIDQFVFERSSVLCNYDVFDLWISSELLDDFIKTVGVYLPTHVG